MYYGDLQVSTISERAGVPANTDYVLAAHMA